MATQSPVYQAMAVRRAFGDDPKTPTYINVLRRGYGLIAPVTPATSPPAEAAAEPALAERSTTVVIPAHAQSGTVGIMQAPCAACSVAVALVIFGTAAAYLAIRKRISKSPCRHRRLRPAQRPLPSARPRTRSRCCRS